MLSTGLAPAEGSINKNFQELSSPFPPSPSSSIQEDRHNYNHDGKCFGQEFCWGRVRGRSGRRRNSERLHKRGHL